jgi:hypothetical protein
VEEGRDPINEPEGTSDLSDYRNQQEQINN